MRAFATARPVVLVLAGAALLVAISLLMFLALAALPGDAASQTQGLRATAESLAAQRATWGLDQPVLVRWWGWLSGAIHGDLGVDLTSGRLVSDVLAGPLARSAVLAVVALIGAVLVGVTAGVLAGLRPDTETDRVLSTVVLLAVCTPEFVVAVGLISLFAQGLGWLPAVSLLPVGGGLDARPSVLVLPALTLIVVAGGALARLIRPVARELAASAHVEAARLAGLPPWTVLRRHLLPGLAAPVAALIALTVPYLLGGAVVVESVFSYPGLGSVLVAAVTAREPAVTLSAGLALAVVAVLAWVVADALHSRSGGRARLGAAR